MLSRSYAYVLAAIGFSSAFPSPSVAQTTLTPRLANVSVLGYGDAGDQILTAGFVLSGGVLAAPPGFSTTGTVTNLDGLFVRAVGPGLAAFGLSGYMPNPSLFVFSGTQAFLFNDDWWDTPDAGRLVANEAAQVSAFPLVLHSLDAAAATSVSHGSYTMQVYPSDGRPGIALAEVYETANFEAGNPTITNVSGRAEVGGAAGSLTAGFVIKDGPRTLLIRAAGPALAAFGIAGALQDPVLTVYAAGTGLAANAGWSNGGNSVTIASAVASINAFPFAPGSADSAVIVTVPPGAYTATVTSASNGSGIALVEIYDISAPP